MRAVEAETFSGYGGLRQIELPKPQPAKDRVLVRVTAAGVTPLDHTILSPRRRWCSATRAAGFAGVLSNWLGWEDSNSQMAFIHLTERPAELA
jgi:NADPH:quinone reductase-like Zn-dependent oxidoreductase